MQSGSDNGISSDSLIFLKFFLWLLCQGFQVLEEEEKRLESSFHCLRERDICLTTDIISQIPMVRMCKTEFQTWCSNFTTIQRFNKFGIVVLLRYRFGCMLEKKSYMRGTFISSQKLFHKSHRWGCVKISFEVVVKIQRQSNG